MCIFSTKIEMCTAILMRFEKLLRRCFLIKIICVLLNVTKKNCLVLDKVKIKV